MSIAADQVPRARVAGRSVAQHQLESALTLACERIICVADGPSESLAALQREAERHGATFHAITGHGALSGLVSAADTLVVLAPDTIPDRTWLAQAFSESTGIAVLPATVGCKLGFERIDGEWAWAGVLVTRGDAVEALASLPYDAEPTSGLLRIALQRRATLVRVPPAQVEPGRWALVRDAARAGDYEQAWFEQHVPAPSRLQPGAVLAFLIARTLVQRSGDALRGGWSIAGAGVVLALAAALAGYLEHTAAALAALTAASLASSIGVETGRFAAAGSVRRKRTWLDHACTGLLDLALVCIAASAAGGWTHAYVALVFVAVVRLSARATAVPYLLPFADRTGLYVLLTLAACAGAFPEAAAVLSLVALVLLVFGAPRAANGGLTMDR